MNRCPMCGENLLTNIGFKTHIKNCHNFDYDNMGKDIARLIVTMDNCRESLKEFGIK